MSTWYGVKLNLRKDPKKHDRSDWIRFIDHRQFVDGRSQRSVSKSRGKLCPFVDYNGSRSKQKLDVTEGKNELLFPCKARDTRNSNEDWQIKDTVEIIKPLYSHLWNFKTSHGRSSKIKRINLSAEYDRIPPICTRRTNENDINQSCRLSPLSMVPKRVEPPIPVERYTSYL